MRAASILTRVSSNSSLSLTYSPHTLSVSACPLVTADCTGYLNASNWRRRNPGTVMSRFEKRNPASDSDSTASAVPTPHEEQSAEGVPHHLSQRSGTRSFGMSGTSGRGVTGGPFFGREVVVTGRVPRRTHWRPASQARGDGAPGSRGGYMRRRSRSTAAARSAPAPAPIPTQTPIPPVCGIGWSTRMT